MKDNKLLGDLGEKLAVGVLYAQGYEILERNYRCNLGEADLICLKDGEVCFVEVKTRTSLSMGRPCEAVGREKQRHLKNVARYYTSVNHKENSNVSFQVFEILVNQIENAF